VDRGFRTFPVGIFRATFALLWFTTLEDFEIAVADEMKEFLAVFLLEMPGGQKLDFVVFWFRGPTSSSVDGSVGLDAWSGQTDHFFKLPREVSVPRNHDGESPRERELKVSDVTPYQKIGNRPAEVKNEKPVHGVKEYAHVSQEVLFLVIPTAIDVGCVAHEKSKLK